LFLDFLGGPAIRDSLRWLCFPQRVAKLCLLVYRCDSTVWHQTIWLTSVCHCSMLLLVRSCVVRSQLLPIARTLSLRLTGFPLLWSCFLEHSTSTSPSLHCFRKHLRPKTFLLLFICLFVYFIIVYSRPKIRFKQLHHHASQKVITKD